MSSAWQKCMESHSAIDAPSACGFGGTIQQPLPHVEIWQTNTQLKTNTQLIVKLGNCFKNDSTEYPKCQASTMDVVKLYTGADNYCCDVDNGTESKI